MPAAPPPPRVGTPRLRPPRLPLSAPTTQFHVVIGSRAEEGQYNLNFHNCYNSKPGQEQPFDITVSRGGLATPHPPWGRAVGQKLMCPSGRWED